MSTGMPPPPPRPKKDDMRKQALSGLLTAIGPGSAGLTRSVQEASHAGAMHQRAGAMSAGRTPQPLPLWSQYWDECKTVELPDRGGAFNVYCAGSKGPVLLAVHGAGYTGLTWSLVAAALKDKYRIIAPDLRGHGLTKATPENDFSNKTLSEDMVALWHALFPEAPPTEETQQSADSPQPENPAPAGDPRATVIIGHSMGGAVAVWTAALRRIPSLRGCVVVDVVEGTALAALPHMMGVIAARPTSFPSPAAAVQWAVKTGMSHNPAAAAISLPSQLVPAAAAAPPATAAATQPATQSVGEAQFRHTPLTSTSDTIAEEDEEEQEGADGDRQQAVDASQPHASQPRTSTPDAGMSSEPPGPPACSDQGVTAQEEGHTEEEGTKSAGASAPGTSAQAPAAGTGSWVWRTSLVGTQPYWQEWYTGLSDAFLALPMPKVLLLAGSDRLDKALTIGQMQGKFQLVVLPKAGHAIQEDDPAATHNALDMFVQRQRIGAPPLAVPRPAGVRPVLPVVAGPLFQKGQ